MSALIGGLAYAFAGVVVAALWGYFDEDGIDPAFVLGCLIFWPIIVTALLGIGVIGGVFAAVSAPLVALKRYRQERKRLMAEVDAILQ